MYLGMGVTRRFKTAPGNVSEGCSCTDDASTELVQNRVVRDIAHMQISRQESVGCARFAEMYLESRALLLWHSSWRLWTQNQVWEKLNAECRNTLHQELLRHVDENMLASTPRVGLRQ